MEINMLKQSGSFKTRDKSGKIYNIIEFRDYDDKTNPESGKMPQEHVTEYRTDNNERVKRAGDKYLIITFSGEIETRRL